MGKTTISTLGQLLRNVREEAHLSLREVATKINIDTSLLGKIERNKRQPTKEHLKQLAVFFSINEKELINEYLSDQIAKTIIMEGVGVDILLAAKKKVEFYSKTND
jgi:transcriptional regulator with XRE-family HTH domain